MSEATSHADKLTLARRHRTQYELIIKKAVFDTAWWNKRKAKIKARVATREAVAKIKSEERKKRNA